jgi:hypothetical protein
MVMKRHVVTDKRVEAAILSAAPRLPLLTRSDVSVIKTYF